MRLGKANFNKRSLSLSSIAPDEMAFRIMKAPGYTAVTAGEVLYIIKCVPDECKVRQTEGCYNELPVTHTNSTYFLSPKSRILLKGGTQRDCNELLPPMFRIHDTWFRMMPRPVEALPPPVIKPLSKPTWRYVSPANLATSGIYTPEDLDRLKNHIMFPVEKPSMLNTLAQGAMGHPVPAGSISLYHMMDEKTLEKIAESAGARLWKGFITFGSASAGLLAIILLIRVAKLVVDSVIRGYAHHSIYGWSIHLLGAIWSSITHLLLHLGTKSRARSTEPADPEAAEELHPLSPTNICEKCSEVTTSEQSAVETQTYGELNKYLRVIENKNSKL